MDPIRPNIGGPNVQRPDVNAPQTASVGTPGAKSFADNLGGPGGPSGPSAKGTGGAPSDFQRVGDFVRRAAAKNPDKAAVFREVVEQEVRATLGPSVSPETVAKATAVLSDSPEMAKLFDQVYQKAMAQRAP
jgi:hypothetical protein